MREARHRKKGWSAKPVSERHVQRKLGDAKQPLSVPETTFFPISSKFTQKMFEEIVHCQMSVMHSFSNF